MSNNAQIQTGPKQRQALWNSLGEQEWDLLVVGGGITGAGIFRQAAKAGYKVLLVEQQDYAWGTSSRSSKMVHGGFRYIAQGDIQLTKEALHEREQMLKEVPGLVDRSHFVFPMRKGRFPGRFALTVLLKVYDLLAGVSDCRFIKNDDLAIRVPGIAEAHTKGAVSYSDAITDDSRLVMRVIQEGKSYSGCALNYVKADSLSWSDEADKKIETVTLLDQKSGKKTKITAKVVVNATGAWADNLMLSAVQGQKGKLEKKVRPLRGSHLVLKADKFSLNDALTLIHPKDGRPIFMFPWYGRILLGTTDLDYPENLDIEAVITDQEVEYLLQVVNEFFPESECDRNDIVSSFCGVRPVISSGTGVDPSKEKRGHSIWEHNNLISVSGGKLTIWRVIADEVLAKVQALTGSGHTGAFDSLFDEQKTSLGIDVPGISPDFAKVLLGRYGQDLDFFLAAYPVDEYEEIDNYKFSIADCRWAIDKEQVEHLDDLLFRRTRLGLLDNEASLAKKVLGFLKESQEWSDQKAQEELDRYQSIKKQYYALPV